MDHKKLKTLAAKIDTEKFLEKAFGLIAQDAFGKNTRGVLLLYLEMMIAAHAADLEFCEENFEGIAKIRNAHMMDFETRISDIVCIESRELAELRQLHAQGLCAHVLETFEYEVSIAPKRYGNFEKQPHTGPSLPTIERRSVLEPLVSVDTVYET